jgi:hypothetical protein
MSNKTRFTANLVSSNNLFVDTINSRVGIASTQPTAELNVIGIVSATTFYGDGSNLSGVSAEGLDSRSEVSTATGSIGAGLTADITITGAKSYSLLKVGISSAAWVRIYTDTDSRTSDETRAYDTDPLPGAGVLAEVYTTTSGISTFKMTPAVVGWNDDGTPSTNIYAKVTNNEGSAADITVTLTIVNLEA